MSNIQLIRTSMRAADINAYIIPITDPHLGEYVPAHSKALHWVSGFTGSAGIVVVTQEFAGLWTDSRYFIQAEQELKGSGIELMKLRVPHTPQFLEWISDNVGKGQKVAVDGRNISRAAFQQLQKVCEKYGLHLDAKVDLVSENWKGRPQPPEGKIFDHAVRFAGKSRTEKLHAVSKALKDKNVNYLLLSSLDDIAWLTNLRGSDMPHLPVFLAHAVIGHKEAALFLGLEKIEESLQKRLKKAGFQVFSYQEVPKYLEKLPPKSTVMLDAQKVSQDLPGSLPATAKIVEGTTPTTLMKACKNEVETAQIRKTMVTDGIVLTKFYYWLDQQLDIGGTTELKAQQKLEALRKEHGATEESFGPISAYAAHAAMPHYHATTKSDVPIKRANVYLLDSGGQYESGTTDTTRVLAFGTPSAAEKRDYTLVLKGLIACSEQRFPKGTQGYQLDALARMHLWNEGIDFGHGTGHGVGFFLDVHEGPQNIRPSASRSNKDSVLQAGMVTSIEPGIYREGQHGIRIENLVLCVEGEKTEFGEFLAFETLTIAPICTNLVEKAMLSKSELKWLRDYNKWVMRKIGRKLNQNEREWLKNATKI